MSRMPLFFGAALVALALWLTSCGNVPLHVPQTPDAARPTPPVPMPDAALPRTVLLRNKSQWVAVPWPDLPGFEDDALFEAWNAFIKSCERPGPVFAPLCPEIRRLSIGTDAQQREWLLQRLQPYRVEPLQAEASTGLLTAYFEPEFEARRQAGAGFSFALHQAPAGLTAGRPYQSIGRWLLDQGELRDASWPGIRAWLMQNPQRTAELLWRNPRVVFFKEEPLNDFDAAFGPRGAQGVPLTPGRSIAVDPDSIPYGTPVWLASVGPSLSLQRLVLAQDTGSAITGALRADYFVGWGAQAGELAGRLKQPLRLWVLWPKQQR